MLQVHSTRNCAGETRAIRNIRVPECCQYCCSSIFSRGHILFDCCIALVQFCHACRVSFVTDMMDYLIYCFKMIFSRARFSLGPLRQREIHGIGEFPQEAFAGKTGGIVNAGVLVETVGIIDEFLDGGADRFRGLFAEIEAGRLV